MTRPETPKLTGPQRKALLYLSERPYAAPSEIGYAMTGGQHSQLKGQGAGRLGGTMGARLERMGLARTSNRRAGFPAYEITSEGRAALRRAMEASHG